MEGLPPSSTFRCFSPLPPLTPLARHRGRMHSPRVSYVVRALCSLSLSHVFAIARPSAHSHARQPLTAAATALAATPLWLRSPAGEPRRCSVAIALRSAARYTGAHGDSRPADGRPALSPTIRRLVLSSCRRLPSPPIRRLCGQLKVCSPRRPIVLPPSGGSMAGPELSLVRCCRPPLPRRRPTPAPVPAMSKEWGHPVPTKLVKHSSVASVSLLLLRSLHPDARRHRRPTPPPDGCACWRKRRRLPPPDGGGSPRLRSGGVRQTGRRCVRGSQGCVHDRHRPMQQLCCCATLVLPANLRAGPLRVAG